MNNSRTYNNVKITKRQFKMSFGNWGKILGNSLYFSVDVVRMLCRINEIARSAEYEISLKSLPLSIDGNEKFLHFGVFEIFICFFLTAKNSFYFAFF